MFLNLLHLVLVIKCHHGHTLVPGELNVRLHLTRVSEDDSLGRHTQAEDLLYLSPAGAVEPGPEAGEALQEGGVVVALDGIEGLHARAQPRPLLVLLDDRPEVTQEESIFIALLGYFLSYRLFEAEIISMGV